MAKKTIREEIYDENGLLEVREYEVEDNTEELINQKEQMLIQIYQEIQDLKNSSSSGTSGSSGNSGS
jgi:hypothetical protein